MSEDRLRLFVALALPENVRCELSRWRPAMEGLRFVAAQDLHVTLCFLGSLDAGAVPGVVRECGAVAGMAAAPLTVGEALWLPRRAPRVLAVALHDRGGGLGAVQSRLAGALAQAGLYRPEARPFLPHATVARVRRGARVRAVALEDPPPVQFVGRELTVFRSRLGAGGARYEALGSVVLGG